MKKFYKFITVTILGLISVAIISCKQYKFDLDEWFDYWTSIPAITENNISAKDSDGFYCISHNTNEIHFKLRNIRKFILKTENIVEFKNTTPPPTDIFG